MSKHKSPGKLLRAARRASERKTKLALTPTSESVKQPSSVPLLPMPAAEKPQQQAPTTPKPDGEPEQSQFKLPSGKELVGWLAGSIGIGIVVNHFSGKPSALYVSAAVLCIFIYWHSRHMTLLRWLLVPVYVLILFGTHKYVGLEASQSSPPVPAKARKMPRFSERLRGLRIKMGGSETTKSLQQLQSADGAGLIKSPGVEVRARATNQVLYLDVDFFAKSDAPPMQIRKNELINKPVGWDMNSDDLAMEVVNDRNDPILQLVYPTDNIAVIRSFFTNDMGYVIMSEHKFGIGRYGNQRPTNPLSRIFEYPSYRFPGKRTGP